MLKYHSSVCNPHCSLGISHSLKVSSFCEGEKTRLLECAVLGERWWRWKRQLR